MLDLFAMLARQLMLAYGGYLGLTGDVTEALAAAAMIVVSIAWAIHKNGHWERFKSWLSKHNMV